MEQNDDIGFRLRGTGITESNVVVADDLLDYGDFVSSGDYKKAVSRPAAPQPARPAHTQPVQAARVTAQPRPAVPKPSHLAPRPAARQAQPLSASPQPPRAEQPRLAAPAQTATPAASSGNRQVPPVTKGLPSASSREKGAPVPASDAILFDPETASGAVTVSRPGKALPAAQPVSVPQTVPAPQSFAETDTRTVPQAEEPSGSAGEQRLSARAQKKLDRKEQKAQRKRAKAEQKAQKKLSRKELQERKAAEKAELKRLKAQDPAEAERRDVVGKAERRQEKRRRKAQKKHRGIEADSVSLDEFHSKAEIQEARKKERALQKERREREKAEQKQARQREQANQVKVPIGGKLIAIISLLFIVALGGLTYLVSIFVTADVRNSAEENNLSATTRAASDTENRIESTVSAVGLFMDLLRTAGSNETELRSIESMFFSRNADVGAVYLPATDRLFTSSSFFVSRESDAELVHPYFMQESDVIEKAAGGTVGLENATPFFSIPTMAIFFPLTTTGEDNVVAIIYSTEAMSENFSSSSINQTFLVNDDGSVLVHSDAQLMAEGGDESGNPVVEAMLESSGNTASQITFLQDGEEYIGAFKRLGIGNGGIVTTVKTSVILEGVTRTTRRNLYISVAILAIAILAVYFFAKSLSVPLKKLSAVVNEINQGNFNTELFGDLGKGSKDEVGVLIKSTHNEREILNTFTKLTNKGVTKAIIKKEIDFDPHLKDITIFFSDIRGFTAISDGFKNRFGEKSAAEIIGFLNDYMSRMVTCISRTGGTVDKFEGDAIMACWGVLRNESLDWEKKDETSVSRALAKEAHDKYVKADALSGITCCIAMRYSLMKYNKDAAAFTEEHKDEPLAQYKPQIRIGAGLNSGRATVGFMGSFDKMEFTSIGDAVNFASRTEASNKPCGTDILMTEDTYAILKKDYIRCEENNFTILPENKKYEIIVEQIPVEFEVKGKGKQHFYGVVNMPGFDIQDFFGEDDPSFRIDMDCARSVGPIGPKTLSELRALLNIPEPDFGKVNLDAEENKIQVATA